MSADAAIFDYASIAEGLKKREQERAKSIVGNTTEDKKPVEDTEQTYEDVGYYPPDIYGGF